MTHDEWKTIRILKDTWREAKKAVAGEDVDLDDFLSFIIDSTDLEKALADYLKLLEDEEGESEEDSSKEDE
jgi:hypothetical protein